MVYFDVFMTKYINIYVYIQHIQYNVHLQIIQYFFEKQSQFI